MSATTRTLAALLLALLAAPAVAKDDYVYGPVPDWSEYKKLGEAAIRAILPDPDRWAVEWPNGYRRGPWPMRGKPQGYVTCGVLHATREVDGGYPRQVFAVIIDRGEVKGVDYRPKPSNSVTNLLCAGLVEHGSLPPASMMETAGASAVAPSTASSATIAAIAPLGISVRPMPEGAYVSSVTTGSPAAIAGLTAGMVITKAANIPLTGMGEAMGKLLAADTPTLSIETATGAHLQIKRTSK